MNEPKDRVALGELRVVIEELKRLLEKAERQVGKCRPIISSGDIDLIKDHLDLVVKYSKLY